MFKQLRARGLTVRAVDKFGHDPLYPVTNNWPYLVAQLQAFTEREVAKAGEPAFLVGHSLGGFLSIMCAAQHPSLARGVLLLDSPLLSGWQAAALGAVKRTPLVGAVTPGAVSRRRRNHWPSIDAAFEHFRNKKAFKDWGPQVLNDYVTHCTDAVEGERVLSFDRDVETDIYNTIPHNLDRLLRRHPLRCPAAFIGGLASQELRQVGLKMTQEVTRGRMTMMEGSHLFPMEKPLATAAAIEAALLAMR